MANDMAAAIVPKSDQINADDLISGPITITIASVTVSPGTEQPVSMAFEGSKKFYRPCKSMSRVLVSEWGPDSSKYVGRSLTLYRDPKVTWGGMEVGGIRISHMSDIPASKTMALTATKQSRKLFTVHPLKDAPKEKPTPEPKQDTPTMPEDAALWAAECFKAIKASTDIAAIETFNAWFAMPQWAALQKVDKALAKQLLNDVKAQAAFLREAEAA